MSLSLQAIQSEERLLAVYSFMDALPFPYDYRPKYPLWRTSLLEDTDGAGVPLFQSTTLVGAYDQGRLLGFSQYGFADPRQGGYPVLRLLYFDPACPDAGEALLHAALEALSGHGRIYAFFHYFGMSCYGRHGKLSCRFDHVHRLLLDNGFAIEHENLFYSSLLERAPEPPSSLSLCWEPLSLGRERRGVFFLNGREIGDCEVHFLQDAPVAYLRWIGMQKGLQHQGLGTRCMQTLRHDLFAKGIRRLDTDTALQNLPAQGFYAKTAFSAPTLTRSYLIP